MKFQTWALIILAAAFALYILFDKDKVIDHSLQDYQVAQRDSLIHKLSRQQTVDSLKTAQKLAELNAEIKGKERQVVKLTSNLERLKGNPIVIKVRDSIPEIEATFQAYDLLLESKDQQLAIQNSKILVLEDENKRITANFLERLQLTEENYLTQKEIVEDYKKQLRKERRKKKLATVLIPVVGVAGLLLGSL